MFLYFKNFISEIFCRLYSYDSLIKKDVSYYSQWESPKLVEDIINRKIKTNDDLEWKKSGAKDFEEYELWSWNICGMACLKMILKSSLGKEFQTVDLAKKCAKYGGYYLVNGKIIGLIYEPFCEFIKKEFELNSSVAKVLSIRRIKYEISKNNFVIVSVSQNIRNSSSCKKTNKGGHLVLMTGYNDRKKVLYLNNPSGYFNKSQKDYEISENDFKKFFSRRGIIIEGK